MRNDEKGFTLVESLVALSGFLIIVTICSFSLKPFIHFDNTNRINEFEWELFIQQCIQEFYNSRDFYVENDKLCLKSRDNKLVQYEMYGNKLRRRVNGTGHEILLQQVKRVTFSIVPKGVLIRLEDDIQTYETIVVYHHDKGG
ncbi:MAG: competence type IV pilus minor pilin ComGF [Bacillaceae bacterium]